MWNSKKNDGSMHAMGNGKMVAYGQGPNLACLYGEPYSSPSALTITMQAVIDVTDTMTRESGTGLFSHTLRDSKSDLLSFTEFVASDIPVYVRLVEANKECFSFIIHPNPDSGFKPNPSIPGTWLQIIKPGSKIFTYPSNFRSFSWVCVQGDCHTKLNDKGELIVTCQRGSCSIAVVGSCDYPKGVEYAERVMSQDIKRLYDPTLEYWNAFTKRRMAHRPELGKLPRELGEMLDGIAVLIKAQQAETGGVMAGHYYPLAYVRDQFGTARGMLSLGMVEEARSILEFRLNKFKTFGTIQNAEAMGTDCARHIHENDDVEITGYNILEAKDYIQATGDDAFGKELWPMMEWCWNAQLKHLAGGMLPFNGDETYVAGSFFPRSGLNQGSADSTLVFIESGKWLIEWAVAQGLWTKDYAAKQKAIIDESRTAYRKHFLSNGRVFANCPEREDMITPPKFRHGVCEGLCQWFGWTQRTENGRYLCPNCFSTKELPAESPEPMVVNSVSLLPLYIGSDILTENEAREVIENVLAQADDSGHIPSVPGTVGCVGYDPGLVLYNLVKLKHPAAKQASERLLRMLDDSGAWIEYYGAGDEIRPSCRVRPWESAINADALIAYLMSEGI